LLYVSYPIINLGNNFLILHYKKEAIMNKEEKAPIPKKTDEETRREFLIKAGKMALYIPPAMMVLMHPSRNAFACKSLSVRPISGNNFGGHSDGGKPGGGFFGGGKPGGGFFGGGKPGGGFFGGGKPGGKS
jgi:uncharacterized membrane protein